MRPLLLLALFAGAAQAQHDRLISALASDDANAREEASRELRARSSGTWVAGLLSEAHGRSAEVRQRVALALGRNPQLLGELAAAATGEQAARRELAQAAIRRHYIEHRLPVPEAPDRVDVLPREPVHLDAIEHLADLVDALLASQRMGLPVLLDPAADRDGAAARRAFVRARGAIAVRALLPRPRASGLRLVVFPEGSLITASTPAPAFDELFLRGMLATAGGVAITPSSRRAAVNLGVLAIPSLVPCLEREARDDGDAGELACLALAAAMLRGHGVADFDAVAARFLQAMRLRPGLRLLLGAALRRPLEKTLALGPAPKWLMAGDGLRDPMRVALLAACRPGVLAADLRALVTAPATDTQVRVCAMLGLRKVVTPLPLLLAQRVRALALAPNTEQAMLTAALDLLTRRDPGWSAGLQALPAASLGESLERGRLWGRALRRAGAQGDDVLLTTLRGAKGVTGAHLGLLEGSRDGGGPTFARWQHARSAANAGSKGSLLVDLAIGAMTLPPVQRREDQARWGQALVRLQEAAAGPETEEPPGLRAAIARAMSVLLLATNARVGGLPPAHWLVEAWLVRRKQPEAFLAGAERFAEDRPLIVRDLKFELARRRRQLAGNRRMLLLERCLDRMLLGRGLKGLRLVDPADPLLRPGIVR